MTLKEAYWYAEHERNNRARNKYKALHGTRKVSEEELNNLQRKVDYANIVLEALREKAEREGVNLDGEE